MLPLLEKLLTLAQAQQTAIEADDLDRFEAIMVERASVLQALELIDAEGSPKALDVVLVAGIPSEDAPTIEALARKVLAQDRENERLMAEQMASVRTELPQLSEGQRAAAAYRVTERPSTFIDRVS
jgi:hypothetical protein